MRVRSGSSSTSQARMFVLVLAATLVSPVSCASSCSGFDFGTNAVKDFIDARCSSLQDGRQKASVWVYEGCLVDPFNGRRIAEVEGMELVRHLTENYPTVRQQRGDAPARSEGSVPETGLRAAPARHVRAQRRLGNLLASTLLFPTSTNDAPPSWDYATTVLSRKIFCYRDPTDRRRLLSALRLRPGMGKVRRIATREAVALYDTATTFVSRDGGRELDVHTEWPNGRSLLAKAGGAVGSGGPSDWSERGVAHAVFPSNHKNKNKKSSFEYTVYARGQTDTAAQINKHGTSKSNNANGPQLALAPTRQQLLDLNKERRQKQNNKKKSRQNYHEHEEAATISPPRTRLVQFGPEKLSNNRYGARESYSYSFPSMLNKCDGAFNNTNTNKLLQALPDETPVVVRDVVARLSRATRRAVRAARDKAAEYDLVLPTTANEEDEACVVRYTRYGEAPPWYGPGRMCTLELVGRKVPSLAHAPPLVAGLAAEHVSGFASVDRPVRIAAAAAAIRTKMRHGADDNPTTDHDDDDQNNDDYDTAAARAVRWFREDDHSFFLPSVDENDYKDDNIVQNIQRRFGSNGKRGFWTKGMKKAGDMIHTIQKATVVH